MNDRLIRCRYKRRNSEMCPNPALDQAPDARVVICSHHAARVIEIVREARDRAKQTTRR